MRIGISTSMGCTDARDWARQMKNLGCGSVVFPLDHTAPEKEIAAYVDAARDADLVIAEVGIWKNVLAKDARQREEARSWAVGQLRLADEIGALCCVNITGTYGGEQWDGGYAENYSRECWEEVVRYTRDLIDTVKPTHTKYSLEPMPWMIPTSPDECLQILQDVDREAFGFHMDLINMINTPQRYFFADAFIDECFDKLGDRILSCHLKDIRLRPQLTFQLEEVPCGEGKFPILHYIRRINECNPDMPVIIEHLTDDDQYIRILQYVQNQVAAAEAGQTKENT